MKINSDIKLKTPEEKKEIREKKEKNNPTSDTINSYKEYVDEVIKSPNVKKDLLIWAKLLERFPLH